MASSTAPKIPRLLGVVGAGQMGAGIAQTAAAKGFPVIMADVSRESLDRGTAAIHRSLARQVQKGQITQEEAALATERIQTDVSLKALGKADFVIEAVSESEKVKQSIFGQLSQITGPDTVLASNTSSISITRIATATQRPQQVVGMHFMNPVPVMKLVELIRGMQTSDEVHEAADSFARHLGKTVCNSNDRPGFIVNRVLMPMINEAFYTLMEGVGTAQDIDNGMKLGTNQPMGPLQLADFIGLDTCLAIMRVMHAGLGDSKYRPCPLLVQYVDAGRFLQPGVAQQCLQDV
ncbi:TPA: hypothetical protein ACH3X1_011822 [Trebouxia sp. C0004]